MTLVQKIPQLLAVIFTLFTFVGKATADDYHYSDVIIGERPAGMGGAYVAVSDDTAGLYYNPAGITLAQSNSVSASVNTWRQERKTYVGGNGSSDYGVDSTTLQPNFFGIIQHTPFGAIGFSYVVRDSLNQHQDLTWVFPDTTSATENLIDQVNTYNIGPSMAFKVANNIRVGITLYYFYKNETYIDNYAYTVFGNNNQLQTQWENNYTKDEESGTRPILGILYAPEDGKYSVGLSLSKTFVFSANQYSQYTCRHPVASGANDPCYTQNDPIHPTVGPTIAHANVLPDYPTEVRLGWAYFPNKDFLLSADLDYFDSASPDTMVYDWNRQPIINAAVGVEYYLNSGFAVRAGLYTDRSNIDAQGLIQSQIA
jgi:long-chain fatty acid transport protein